MENASKALIIAGAILLAILIISLGLLVYNQAKDAATGIGLDEAQISSFNSKFASYEGSNKTGAQVNALIQQVISSNQAAINDNTETYVSICFKSVSKYNEDYNSEVVISVDKENKVLKYNVVSCSKGESKYVEELMNYGGGYTTSNQMNTYFSPWDTISSASLKVNTGKKYTVTFGYSNGAIDRIGVAEQ